MIFKLGLILQIMNYIDHCLKGKIIGLMKDELDGIIKLKFVGLRAKTYSCIIDNGSEDKNVKDTKRCVKKRKRKFEIKKTV